MTTGRKGNSSEARRLRHLNDKKQGMLFDGPRQSGSVANESSAPVSNDTQRSAFADDAAEPANRIESWPQVAPPVIVKVPGINMDDPITVRFLAFHKAKPYAYDLMREAAHTEILEQQQRNTERLIKEGKPPKKLKISSKALTEKIRKKCDGINNDFTSRYARLLDYNEPELKGLFEFRTCKGEEPQ